MKKLLFALILILTVGALNTQKVSAQSTKPRFGTATNQSNTGAVLFWGYNTLTDAAGADSTVINTKFYETVYRINLLDSFMLKDPIVTRAYAGDMIRIVAVGANGTKLKFASTNWVCSPTVPYATTTIILGALGRASLVFMFDGAKWVEQSRVVN